MAFDAEAFIDATAAALVTQASDELKAQVFGNEKLQEAIQEFAAQAKAGLGRVAEGVPGAVGDLERRLSARKSDLVAAATSCRFDLERLVSKACDSIKKKALELARP